MKTFQKRSFPVDQTRRYLEPGPIVLVSSHWQGESNIMTMGWHMMLEYDRIGCYIWDENHSFDLIRKSKQCVINLPTIDLIDTIDGIAPRPIPLHLRLKYPHNDQSVRENIR